MIWLVTLAVLSSAVCDDSPPGLVSKDSEQDLVAEASNTAQQQQQAQKREATLSNSYGEPLPSDAYGPPSHIPIVPDLQSPAPVYGVPEFQNNQINTPPGAYGPPSPINFPSQVYEGPPPPVGKLKTQYGPPKFHAPPKQIYGPPKPVYGPPKKTYGPPKQILPKPIYGAPFKSQKINFPKPVYGPPKQVYGPPKQVYGPSKPVYGPPKQTYGAPINPVIPLQDFGAISLPPVTVHSDFGIGGGSFGGISNDVDLGLNLPAPIYGTPINNVQIGSKPNFPVPSDHYGPPGHFLGPVGPNDQVVVEGFSNVGHYGPPQPDPNPRPPHPGIPAPPTPPHVLYDGWKPIPGVSKPIGHVEHQHIEHQQHFEQHHHHHHVEDHYGPPPPPPPQVQEIHVNLDGHSLPSAEQSHQFSGAQVSTGVHHDALADIDLNAIVGGDSNHIDQSKTVFEAHYTENIDGHGNSHEHSHQQDVILSAPSSHGKPFDTYGAPPVESLSNGPYPSSLRQQSGKVLIPPSGIYGVPPGGQYGAPPRPPPAHLPIPYGSSSGGGNTGGASPRHPIKFRESVPDGLFQHIAHSTHHKDAHITDHSHQGPAYVPPPIRDIKDISHQTGNHGVGLSLSIEPSNLYSLPQTGNPINFQHQPSNLYGSPIDSYSVPLFTVGDHTGSASNVNEVKATVDGSILANLSSTDIAAILKHCPYHEAILKAAQSGEKIPADLAASYVASLSSLGSKLYKNKQVLISPQNGFNTPVPGSDSVSYNSKDLSSASHTLVQTILPSNEIKNDKTEKNTIQKGKSLKDDTGKHGFKQDNYKYVSDQIQQTSDKITKLSEETNKLHKKIVSTNENINQVNGQITQYANEIPIKGNLGSYSLQIQSADGSTKGGAPSIPHEQLLSEGLLQSILSAIEQPSSLLKQVPNPHFRQPNFKQTKNTYTSQSNINLANADKDGLILPAGYEPIDRTKENNVADQEIQSSNHNINQILFKESHQYTHHRGDIPPTDCELKADNSIRQIRVVPAPETSIDNVQQVNDIDENDVAIYFDEKSDEKSETVTEISVATSISQGVEKYTENKEFGDKIKNNKS